MGPLESTSQAEMVSMVNCSKILNTFLFLLSTKIFVIKARIHKMLVKIANRIDLIRLLLQKQSDLGLLCLFRSFGQTTGVWNFRAFTVEP